MSLEVFWFIVVAFFWTGFFVLEGFDFGVGALHRAIGRDDTDRRVVVNTIGPWWDGNEVWLIVGISVLFGAFPTWYATWFSAAYLVLLVVLLALILRGLSFEWRGRMEKPRSRTGWSVALVAGSVVAPLMLGLALGDLLAGLPINDSQQFTGDVWDLFTPYGVVFALSLLALCLLHGSTFIALRSDGPVRQRAASAARLLVWPGLLLALVVSVWTINLSDAAAWATAVAVVPVLGAAGAALVLRTDREGLAFASTAVAVGGTVASLFANLYPAVMVSSTDAANNLTVANTASADYALKVMTIVAVIIVPLVLLYQGWSYYVFRARVAPPAATDPVADDTRVTAT